MEETPIRPVPRKGGVLPLLAAGLAWLAFPAQAQFSPGPLSKAHSSLSGPTHCTDCHSLAAGGNRRFKCLGCHTDIRTRLANNRGLHPFLLDHKKSENECIRCHSEHNGENFVPIRWDQDIRDLDHRKTGYPLEGKHAGLKCEQCHNPSHISAAERRLIGMKDLKRTYLGLSRQCSSCHSDEHGGQLGQDCQRCHNFVNWKQLHFDHASAKFRLNGAHEKVACAKCHKSVPGAAKPRVMYVGLAFNQCTACHKDPHQGAFAAACQSCHSESAWKPARQLAQAFDHSRTKFPLLGKHIGVSCEKCHRTADFKQPVAHQKCADCHKDQHGGQFLARADGGECGSCHKVEGWKATTFTVAMHAAGKYPLEGKHAAVACEKCHIPRGAATVYKVAFARCQDCHQDTHQGQFAGNRCESCHSTDGFRPSRFTLARHNQGAFPLLGAHLAVACGECHSDRRGKPVPYHFADRSCTSCHVDPHQGQFKERIAAVKADGTRADCLACHGMRSWRELPRFDHSKTSFPLLGAHRAVACQECHRSGDSAAGMKNVVFGSAARQCIGCHNDIHDGQFAERGTTDCARCHSLAAWKPTVFDHDRTAFPLTGGHRGVACTACHKNTRLVNGHPVVVFKPAPKECSSCHGPQIPS